jgi:diaminohydroxyphosphoribosylaminopyrimidine deaminase / 5-amino-6-(5-phosphoribosylamino)uracil reductase
MNFDEKMMALAVSEAKKGWGRTSPNPMVGAVIVKQGRIVAKGHHPYAGGPHAEVVALQQAGDPARGADLYVTLEPCHHHGRTPPCTSAVLAAGISRVVIGCLDVNPNVIGGGAEYLREQGLIVETGVLESRCRELIEIFIKYITTGLPFVIVKAAATLDGKIASKTGHSKWVTGEKARHYVHRIRNGVDAILVGRETVIHDNPSLNTRLPGVKPVRHPRRIVLDTRLGLSPDYRVFDPETGGETIVVCGPEPDHDQVACFEEHGVRVWSMPLSGCHVNLTSLCERLGQEGITSVLVEGGGDVHASALLTEKVADKILFFYAPKIVGGCHAPGLIGGCGRETMNDALAVDILRMRRLGDDILIEAVPCYDKKFDLFPDTIAQSNQV